MKSVLVLLVVQYWLFLGVDCLLRPTTRVECEFSLGSSKDLATTPPISSSSKSQITSDFEFITMEYRNDRFKNKLGTSIEQSPALVLNADYSPLSYMPLSLWSWQDTLRAIFSDRAVIISTYKDLFVRSVQEIYPVPSVIALKQYHKLPSDRAPALSRRNVYLRDGFRCQYCLEKFSVDQLSLDHVIPRSKGGKLTWTNTVSSCCSCNFKKGTTLPEDLPKLGMRLRSMPREPSYHELQSKSKTFKVRNSLHPDWQEYI